MTFLKNLGGTLSNLAGSAADAAKKMAETARLNLAIGTEEKNINAAYLEIGKLVFEEEKNNPESPLAELCAKIVAAQEKIAELNEKIAELKEDKPDEAPAAAHAPAPAAAAGRKFCSNCGTPNSADSKFCSGCGQPMGQ